MSKGKTRERLLTMNDPRQMRIYKELAEEIGFEESVMLLQLEFEIANHENLREERFWYYSSLRDLKADFFPFWSVATISRIINKLEKKQLILVGNFNESTIDRTQWFALNPEGISKLKSVRLAPVKQAASPISQNEISASQNEKRASQFAKSASQNETTIPKISKTKNTETKKEDLSEKLQPSQASAAELKEIFLEIYNEKYQPALYPAKTGDYICLNELRTAQGQGLTLENWRIAAKNYLATPQAMHTIPDLANRYPTFRRNALDKFKNPVEPPALSLAPSPPTPSKSKFPPVPQAPKVLDDQAIERLWGKPVERKA